MYERRWLTLQWMTHDPLYLNFHRIQSFSQNYIRMQCLSGVTHCLFHSWNLASFSFHKCINIRHHILSGSRLQDIIQVLVRESWVQLCFINEHERKLSKICGSKNAQHFCSKGCQVGVTWQEILMKCVQASCGKFARLLFQVGCWWADQKVFLQFTNNLKSVA